MNGPKSTFSLTGELVVTAEETSGFVVVEALPRKLRLHRKGLGALKACKMKGGNSSLFAFVLVESPATIVLWDDRQGKKIGELGPYSANVQRWDWGDDVIATTLLDGRVFVYSLTDRLRLVHSERSHPEACDVLSVATSSGVTRVAYAGMSSGSIVIYNAATDAVTMIRAHEHPVILARFSPDGSRMVTASTHGTVLRVFDIDGRLLEEPSLLRRSTTTKARIHDAAFSHESPPSLLAASFDSGTLHVFEPTKQVSPRLPVAQRSKWRVELPDKEPCNVAFHHRGGSVVMAIGGSGWFVAYRLGEDGSLSML